MDALDRIPQSFDIATDQLGHLTIQRPPISPPAPQDASSSTIIVQISITHSAVHAKLHFPSSELYGTLDSAVYKRVYNGTFPKSTPLAMISKLLTLPTHLGLPQSIHGALIYRSLESRPYYLNEYGSMTLGEFADALDRDALRSHWIRGGLSRRPLFLGLVTTAGLVQLVEEYVESLVRRFRHLTYAVKYMEANVEMEEKIHESKEELEGTLRELSAVARLLERHSMRGFLTDRELEPFACLLGNPDESFHGDDVDAWLDVFRSYLRINVPKNLAKLLHKDFQPISSVPELQPPASEAEVADEKIHNNAQELLRARHSNLLGTSEYDFAYHNVLSAFWSILCPDERLPYLICAIQERRKEIAEKKNSFVAENDPNEGKKWRERQETYRRQQKEDQYKALTRLSFPTVSAADKPRFDSFPTEEPAFVITSGVMLWGQLPTIMRGALQTGFDNSPGSEPVHNINGGTIIQHSYRFRAAARCGSWRVRRASWGGQRGGPESLEMFGWVLSHESIDALEALRRCASLNRHDGSSARNDHLDQDILYVNRYDWGCHWHGAEPSCEKFVDDLTAPLNRTKKKSKTKIRKDAIDAIYTAVNDKVSGYLLVLDAEEYGIPLVETMLKELPVRDEREKPLERALRKGEREAVGAYLSMPQPEWDWAWMVFSGKKHEMHQQADELVAIVFDGEYTHLAGLDFSVE